MENIYLTSSKLTTKEFLKYYMLTLGLCIIFIVLQWVGVISTGCEFIIESIEALLIMLILLQVVSTKLSRCVLNEIKFRSESILAIIVPILAAILTRFTTDFLQALPMVFGGNYIGVGKGQLITSSFKFIDRFTTASLVGPFVEEFLYRVIFFTSIAYMVGFIDSKINKKLSVKVLDLRSLLCWVLIIINNILFSWLHLPDISNFHLYFIGGLVNTIIYIKYGFYGAWISHGSYNLLHLGFLYRWLAMLQ